MKDKIKEYIKKIVKEYIGGNPWSHGIAIGHKMSKYNDPNLIKNRYDKMSQDGFEGRPKGRLSNPRGYYLNELKSKLKNIITDAIDEKAQECPAPTQDLELNTANRNRAIEADFIKYGPLNLSDEEYWVEYAKKWGDTTSPEEAKKSNCGNCIAFDISPRMDKCMPGETSDEDGRLGYCWMHHFKCHSARTCYTWAAGGPIKDDDISYDWQKRNLKGALSKEPIQESMFPK